ncbi:energy-coupling factor transporter transmembrane protein EcfT [Bacillus sp. EAC]|uniref:energy-coupling factor transporter transmembrane component T family protein n=1 Tax=Bacillus sp. EAC TaxID=1978338 RepID=UPI000B4312E6|nr:energy-coupling factor transporter transmembrane protein EcfT [Bacillus sp. EAC]
MNGLIIGKYIPIESLIHRLDARAKLLTMFLFIFIVFFANNLVTYSILFLFVIVTVLLSKVPLNYYFNGLKTVWWLVLFTFILHVFTNKEGPLLYQFGWVEIHKEGIVQGIFISIRFFLLVSITTLLTLTTNPIEITDGLESLFHPFKKLGLPVHEMALMMSISLRFIPTLMEETEKIMKAQSSRGVDFSSGPLKERLKAIVSLLVPLFIHSFKRAEDLAIAMEARGYQGGEGRTKFRIMNWKLRDTLCLIILLILFLLLLFLRK